VLQEAIHRKDISTIRIAIERGGAWCISEIYEAWSWGDVDAHFVNVFYMLPHPARRLCKQNMQTRIIASDRQGVYVEMARYARMKLHTTEIILHMASVITHRKSMTFTLTMDIMRRLSEMTVYTVDDFLYRH
jgi:hypothetical protein